MELVHSDEYGRALRFLQWEVTCIMLLLLTNLLESSCLFLKNISEVSSTLNKLKVFVKNETSLIKYLKSDNAFK